MQWADIPVDKFEAACVETDGFAVIPIGALEVHGPHLPLGCDWFMSEGTARRAAELEPAMVLPAIPFGWTGESTNHPGAICMRYSVLMPWLENLCDEIHRNGFRKILMLTEHGGNGTVLAALAGELIEKEKPYLVYTAGCSFSLIGEAVKQIKESGFYGHACEVETSMALELFGDKVNLQRAIDENHRFKPNDPRPFEKGKVRTGMDWVAAHPEMTLGDPTLATKEKGERLIAAIAEKLAEIFRQIKHDELTPKLAAARYDAARVTRPFEPGKTDS